MYRAAANDFALLQEHAYYETGLEKPSSMVQYQWIFGAVGIFVGLWLIKTLSDARTSRKNGISLPVSEETV